MAPGCYDLGPAWRVGEAEELRATAEREVFEGTGIRIDALRMAYIDELID